MSTFTLKVIALVSMLYDHVTYLWPLELLPLPEGVLSLSHYIGRLAAPIFLWSVANGYRHTRDVKGYALRLLLFACLAEGPYYLLFEMHGNILFTLLSGLLTLRLMDWGNGYRPRLGYVLAALVVALFWSFPLFEGGGRHILFILVFHLTREWPVGRRALLWAVLLPASRWRLLWLCLTEGLRPSLFLLNGVGPLLGVALTLRYNGEKGPDGGGRLKYLWYWAYPLHLLALGLIRLAMRV